jgi:hypothetical protein
MLLGKILEIINKLIDIKYSGDLKITFNQGGIRSVKKVKYENIDLKSDFF